MAPAQQSPARRVLGDKTTNASLRSTHNAKTQGASTTTPTSWYKRGVLASTLQEAVAGSSRSPKPSSASKTPRSRAGRKRGIEEVEPEVSDSETNEMGIKKSPAVEATDVDEMEVEESQHSNIPSDTQRLSAEPDPEVETEAQEGEVESQPMFQLPNTDGNDSFKYPTPAYSHNSSRMDLDPLSGPTTVNNSTKPATAYSSTKSTSTNPSTVTGTSSMTFGSTATSFHASQNEPDPVDVQFEIVEEMSQRTLDKMVHIPFLPPSLSV
jgi:hypothetical protein